MGEVISSIVDRRIVNCAVLGFTSFKKIFLAFHLIGLESSSELTEGLPGDLPEA